MKQVFEMDIQTLSTLSPKRCEESLVMLLDAESGISNIPISNIESSGEINVPDGGVDTSALSEAESENGLIKKGKTSYQVKSGKNLSLSESDVEGILFKSDGSLRPLVKRCFDEKGTFVLASFGKDFKESQKLKGQEIFKKLLKEKGYSDTQVEIWGQGDLIRYFNKFPFLVLNIKKVNLDHGKPFFLWENEDFMRNKFVSNTQQSDVRRKIQDFLKQNNSKYLRVLGAPGVGKTRAVLEALREDNLFPFTVYFGSYEDFKNSTNLIQKLNEVNKAIIVIDECDSSEAQHLSENIDSSKNNHFITIYNEDERSYSEKIILENLDDLSIREIIKSYNSSDIVWEKAYVYSRLCEGSARLAREIGEFLKDCPEENLDFDSLEHIYTRMISGEHGRDSEIFKKRKRVLMCLSLFKKLGYGGNYENEFNFISDLIERKYQISKPECREIIEELRRRKILQGKKTLYISPEILHIWLWSESWKMSIIDDLHSFVLSMPPRKLKKWFYAMFKYCQKDGGALKHIKKILSKEGYFKDLESLEKNGEFFHNLLSEGSTLDCLLSLERLIGEASDEELKKLDKGRQWIAWVLEKICFKKDFFRRGGEILLRLAETETKHHNDNNSVGIFRDLFSCGTDVVATSEASMEERYPFLEEVMNSHSKARRLLGIKALSKSLEIDRISKVVGSQIIGASVTKGWAPKKWGEIYDAWKKYWTLLEKSFFECKTQEERLKILEVVTTRGYSFVQRPYMCDFILNSFSRIVKHDPDYKVDLLNKLDTFLSFRKEDFKKDDSKGEDEKGHYKKILKFVSDHENSDYSYSMKKNLTKYYVPKLEREEFERTLVKLAETSIKKNDEFKSLLDWIIPDNKNGHSFGKILAEQDSDFSLLQDIFDAWEKHPQGSMFFGLYLQVVYKKNKELWFTYMDKIFSNKKSSKFVIEFLFRSGADIDDEICSRYLLKGFKEGKLEKGDSYFHVIKFRKISKKGFNSLFSYLLTSNDPKIFSSVLECFSFVLHDKKGDLLGEENLSKVLYSEFFFKGDLAYKWEELNHWKEAAECYVENFPKKRLEFCKKIVSYLFTTDIYKDDVVRYISPIINPICAEHLDEMFDFFLSCSKDNYKHIFRLSAIAEWFRHDPFNIDGDEKRYDKLIPMIKKWIDKDRDERAYCLAEMSKFTLKKKSLCRFLMENYIDVDGVGGSFASQIYTFSGSGPISKLFEKEKEKLEKMLDVEENLHIKKWLQKNIDGLKKDIKYHSDEEEREDF